MTESSAAVEASTVFEMLAADHRRYLLFALLDHNPQQEVQEPDGVVLDEIEKEKVQMEMYHMHLPKLEDAGFIRWNRDEQQVEKGPVFEEIRPLLEQLRENADKIPGDQSTRFSRTDTDGN
ncbi:ArsR family transcriptional regulator [Halosimplex sp. TS25]|uniref:DUF7344 domain-containing protein n=1 Tax=Halosimplex rarum TaxID=3396619 RepID=UPI0039EA11F8